LAKTSGTEQLGIAPAHSNQAPLECELYKREYDQQYISKSLI